MGIIFGILAIIGLCVIFGIIARNTGGDDSVLLTLLRGLGVLLIIAPVILLIMWIISLFK